MSSYYQGGGFDVPPFVNIPGAVPPVPSTDNGAVWFVAMAPVFSLIIGKLSGSKFAAIVLWVFTYILCVILCRRDCKILRKSGYEDRGIINLAFIPVVYLFARAKLIASGNYINGIVCVIATVIALVNNSIITPVPYSEQDYIDTVRYSYCSEITDLSDKSSIADMMIDDVLSMNDSFADAKWSCSKGKEVSVVTVSTDMTFDGKTAAVELDFTVEYDGFSFGGMKISEVRFGGDTVTGDKRKELLDKVFPDKVPENSSKKDDSYIKV